MVVTNIQTVFTSDENGVRKSQYNGSKRIYFSAVRNKYITSQWILDYDTNGEPWGYYKSKLGSGKKRETIISYVVYRINDV